MIIHLRGEPLIYPHIEALVQDCSSEAHQSTSAPQRLFMRKKMREWMASQLSISQSS